MILDMSGPPSSPPRKVRRKIRIKKHVTEVAKNRATEKDNDPYGTM